MHGQGLGLNATESEQACRQPSSTTSAAAGGPGFARCADSVQGPHQATVHPGRFAPSAPAARSTTHASPGSRSRQPPARSNGIDHTTVRCVHLVRTLPTRAPRPTWQRRSRRRDGRHLRPRQRTHIHALALRRQRARTCGSLPFQRTVSSNAHVPSGRGRTTDRTAIRCPPTTTSPAAATSSTSAAFGWDQRPPSQKRCAHPRTQSRHTLVLHGGAGRPRRRPPAAHGWLRQPHRCPAGHVLRARVGDRCGRFASPERGPPRRRRGQHGGRRRQHRPRPNVRRRRGRPPRPRRRRRRRRRRHRGVLAPRGASCVPLLGPPSRTAATLAAPRGSAGATAPARLASPGVQGSGCGRGGGASAPLLREEVLGGPCRQGGRRRRGAWCHWTAGMAWRWRLRRVRSLGLRHAAVAAACAAVARRLLLLRSHAAATAPAGATPRLRRQHNGPTGAVSASGVLAPNRRLQRGAGRARERRGLAVRAAVPPRLVRLHACEGRGGRGERLLLLELWGGGGGRVGGGVGGRGGRRAGQV